MSEEGEGETGDEGEEEEIGEESSGSRKKVILFGGIGVLLLLLVCSGLVFGVYRFAPKLFTMVREKIPGLSTVEVASTESLEATSPVSATLEAEGTLLPGTLEAVVTNTPDLLATSAPPESSTPSAAYPAPDTPQAQSGSPVPPVQGSYPGPTQPPATAAAGPTVDLTALAYPSPSPETAVVTPVPASALPSTATPTGGSQPPAQAASPTISPTAAQAVAANPSSSPQASQAVTPAPATSIPTPTSPAAPTPLPSATASLAPQVTVTPAKDAVSATPAQGGATASPTAFVAFFPSGTPTAIGTSAVAAPTGKQATLTTTPQAVSPTPQWTATPALATPPAASPTFSPAPILPSATSALLPTPLPSVTPQPTSPPPTAIMTRTAVPTLTPRVTNTPMPSPTPGRAVVPPGQSPYAGWITYAYGQDIRREIYLMNPTTGETKQLTNNLFQDDSPSFSPDNLEIVFTSYREPDGWELFVLNLETEEERQITAFEGIVRFPVWSPKAGDDRIVFDGVQGQLNQQFTNLWMVEGSGRGLVQVTDSGADSGANWSPDGMRLVYSHAEKDTNGDKRITASDMGNIYILDLLTNESQRITWSSTRNDFNFSWSPDAAWIVYCSVRSDSNHDGRLTLDDSRNLYMIKPDGKEDHMIDVGGRAVFWPGWSPDGKMIIVYEPRGSTIGRFWLYDTGTGKINILTSIGPYGRPQYSK